MEEYTSFCEALFRFVLSQTRGGEGRGGVRTGGGIVRAGTEGAKASVTLGEIRWGVC